MRVIIPVVLSLLAGCATAPRSAQYVEVVEGATRIHCRGADLDGPFGSRLARSEMLRAAAAERSAWTEVEALALEDDGGEGSCQNISRLWVREGGSSRVVFTQRPGWEGRNGNALVPVDWSPDGSRLLVELHTWTYPTDPADPTLLVWSAATGQTEQMDVSAMLRSRFAAGCAFRARGEGFDRDGRAVVRVEPVSDAGNRSCVTAPELWALGPNVDTGSERSASAVPTWSRRETPPPRTTLADGR